MLLENKVAVITGASSGLGESAAIAMAKEGAAVGLFARREEKLNAVKEKIETAGGRAIAVRCDVIDEAMVKAAVQQVIDEFGQIDVLVNNAGIAQLGGVHDLHVEDWDRSMDINAKGIFLVSKYVVPHMIERSYGRIVNVTSINALVANKAPTFTRHSYNASKAAAHGLTRGMAATYGVHNITVNAVAPSLFESEMTSDTLFKSEEFMARYNGATPLGRPGNDGELNGTILYFASDMSSYTTGQIIYVDGGFSIV